MPKVNINGHSHQVEIEANDELTKVVRVAKRLWRDTVQSEHGLAGPAFGFHTEQRPSRDLYQLDADGR